MANLRLLKRFHIAGTAWFMFSAAYLLIAALRQAGAHWWVVFSLTGYSAVLFCLLMSVYLFAIFRGVTRNQIAVEHPLTTSVPYTVFYDICPFLGSLAGFLSSSQTSLFPFSARLCLIAEGSLATTFLVWIGIDPLIGVIEMFLPISAAYRRTRLAKAQAERQQIQQGNRKLLADLEALEKTNLLVWKQALEPAAQELAFRLKEPSVDFAQLQRLAAEYGATAWRIGGILCMRFLHKTVKDKQPPCDFDYLTIWWDGIGTWRRPPVQELLRIAG